MLTISRARLFVWLNSAGIVLMLAILAAVSEHELRADGPASATAVGAASDRRAAEFARIRPRVQGGATAGVIVQFDVPNLSVLTTASRAAHGRARVTQSDQQLSARIAAVRQVETAKLAGTPYAVVRTYDAIPFVAMRVSAAALTALERSPGIVGITEDGWLHATLDNTVNITGASAAWTDGYDGSGEYVAILDSGIRDTHHAFAGKTIVQACFSLGQDEVGPVGDCPNGLITDKTSAHAAQHFSTAPTSDHGTHVACIAAGNDSTKPLYGVAPGADLIAVQVFSQIFNDPTCNNNTGGDCTFAKTADILAGLEYVYSLRGSYHIAAVNMSLGGGSFWSQSACDDFCPAVTAAIDNLRGADIASVISSGNEGDCTGIGFPACISSSIAVGNTSDNDLEASDSNYHSSLLDLYAPGKFIYSALGTSDSAYGDKSGTSMAAPHVTGAWAILQQARPGVDVATVLQALQTTGVAVAGRCSPPPTQRRIQIDQALDRLLALDPECTDPLGADPRPLWTELTNPSGSPYPDYHNVSANIKVVKSLQLLASIITRAAEKLQDLSSAEDDEATGRCLCALLDVHSGVKRKDCTLAHNTCSVTPTGVYPLWLPTDLFKNTNNTARFALNHIKFLDGVRDGLAQIATILKGLQSGIQDFTELTQLLLSRVDIFTEGYHLGGYSTERPKLHLCVGYGGHGAFAEMANLAGDISIGARYSSHNLSSEHRAQFRSGGFGVRAFGKSISILPGIEAGLQMDGFKLWDAQRPFGINFPAVGVCPPSPCVRNVDLCCDDCGFPVSDFKKYDIFHLIENQSDVAALDSSNDGCLQIGEFFINDLYVAHYLSAADHLPHDWPRGSPPPDWEKQNTAVFSAGLNLPIKMEPLKKDLPPGGILLFPGTVLFPHLKLDAGVEWSLKAYGLRKRLQDMVNKTLPSGHQLTDADFERPMHDLQAPDTSGDNGTSVYVQPTIGAELFAGIPIGKYLKLGIAVTTGLGVRVEPAAHGGVHDLNVALTDTLRFSNPPASLPCEPVVETDPTTTCSNTLFINSQGLRLSKEKYSCDTSDLVSFHCKEPEETKTCTPANAESDCRQTKECIAEYGCAAHGYCTRILAPGPDGKENTVDDVVEVIHDTTASGCSGTPICREPALNVGQPCTNNSDCIVPRQCAGGPNVGNSCTRDADCPEGKCDSPSAPCEPLGTIGYFTPYQCLTQLNPEITSWKGPGCNPLTVGYASACGCATNADCVAGVETCVSGACAASGTAIECACDPTNPLACSSGRKCHEGACLLDCAGHGVADCAANQTCSVDGCVNPYGIPFAEQILWQISHTTKPQHAVSTYAIADILYSAILDVGLWIGLDLKIFKNKEPYHFDLFKFTDYWVLLANNKTWYQPGLEARYQHDCDPQSGDWVSNWQPDPQNTSDPRLVTRYNPFHAASGYPGNAGTEADLLAWCDGELPTHVADPDSPTMGDIQDALTGVLNWGQAIGTDLWAFDAICVTQIVDGVPFSKPWTQWLTDVHSNPTALACRYTYGGQPHAFPCADLRNQLLSIWGCLDISATPWGQQLASACPGIVINPGGTPMFSLNQMLTDPTGEFTLDNLTLCVRNAGFGISRPGLFWYTAVESCFDSHFAALQPGEIELDGLSIGRCCGNGLLDQQACGGGPGESPCEQCDDGNNVAGDGCSPLCRIEDEQQAPACGDGIVQIGLGEQCDDGNQVSGDGCEPDCTLTYPGSACPAVGMCILPHNSPGCSDPACCSLVCGIDPNCCAFEWTPACVQIAVTQCDACLGECFNGAYCDNPNCCANPDNCVCYPPNSPISQALCPVDCNSNGIPDSQEPDCNGNGVPDDCDVATGYSQDLNTNGVPDECECVGAGVPGDVNNDGAVNFFDILTFLDCFGGPLHATDVGCPCSDFDADRDIDLRDFASFQAAWPLTKAAN